LKERGTPTIDLKKCKAARNIDVNNKTQGKGIRVERSLVWSEGRKMVVWFLKGSPHNEEGRYFRSLPAKVGCRKYRLARKSLETKGRSEKDSKSWGESDRG